MIPRRSCQYSLPYVQITALKLLQSSWGLNFCNFFQINFKVGKQSYAETLVFLYSFSLAFKKCTVRVIINFIVGAVQKWCQAKSTRFYTSYHPLRDVTKTLPLPDYDARTRIISNIGEMEILTRTFLRFNSSEWHSDQRPHLEWRKKSMMQLFAIVNCFQPLPLNTPTIY